MRYQYINKIEVHLLKLTSQKNIVFLSVIFRTKVSLFTGLNKIDYNLDKHNVVLLSVVFPTKGLNKLADSSEGRTLINC